MTIDDIITEDGISEDFMHWLWGTDRTTYSLLLFGHVERITDELIAAYNDYLTSSSLITSSAELLEKQGVDELELAREIVAAIPSLYNLTPEEEGAIILLTSAADVKLVEEGQDDRAEYVPYCPNCNAYMSLSDNKFCPFCGKRISWDNC